MKFYAISKFEQDFIFLMLFKIMFYVNSRGFHGLEKGNLA